MKGNLFRSGSLRVFLSAGFAVSSPGAFADPSPALDRVSVWLGGYHANTDIALNAITDLGNASTGTVHLASGRETVGRARIDFLFFDNQGLSFDYYTLSRSSTRTLSNPFSYEGNNYVLDSTLTGKFDLDAGSAAYHWWFGSGDDVFGIGLGAIYYRVKLGIAGTVAIADAHTSASAHWEEDAVAPLATLAYKHAFADDLRVYVDASGVRKNGGALTGHLYDARAGVEWFPWHNVGIGAEYGVTRIRLDRRARTYDAKLAIDLDGPSLFARFRF
jgi:hypothetical protein